MCEYCKKEGHVPYGIPVGTMVKLADNGNGSAGERSQAVKDLGLGVPHKVKAVCGGFFYSSLHFKREGQHIGPGYNSVMFVCVEEV